MIKDTPKRKNGFVCPWNIPQTIVWIEQILNVITYFTLELPSIPSFKANTPHLIMTILFICLLLGVLYYGFRATVIDAEDSVIAI
jgi:hypothetical protein